MLSSIKNLIESFPTSIQESFGSKLLRLSKGVVFPQNGVYLSKDAAILGNVLAKDRRVLSTCVVKRQS